MEVKEGVRYLPHQFPRGEAEEPFLEPGAHVFLARVKTSKPQQSFCLYPFSELGLEVCSGCLAYYMHTGIRILVLIIAQQVPLTAEPSLSSCGVALDSA